MPDEPIDIRQFMPPVTTPMDEAEMARLLGPRKPFTITVTFGEKCALCGDRFIASETTADLYGVAGTETIKIGPICETCAREIL